MLVITSDMRLYASVYIGIMFEKTDKTKETVTFKVDTGAGSTVMSKESLADLGYDREYLKEHSIKADVFSTAAKQDVKVSYIQIPWMNVLGYEAKNWPIYFASDKNVDFRNLLGLNLLAGFNYKFDNRNHKFEIEKLGRFPQLQNPLANQSIQEIMVDSKPKQSLSDRSANLKPLTPSPTFTNRNKDQD